MKTTKVCKKCHLEKGLEEFYKVKSNKDGLQKSCKKCFDGDRKESRKLYYQENCGKVKESNKQYHKDNSDKIKEQKKQYHKDNSDKIKEQKKQYYKENSDKIKEQKKQYRKENSDKTNEYKKQRYRTDPIYVLKHSLRVRLRKILNSKGFTKSQKTLDMLGCTPEFLKEYLEQQFLPGMTWENHNFEGWHIDHIIPLASAQNEEEVYKLCHYTNLQPLWAKDNFKKGSKT